MKMERNIEERKGKCINYFNNLAESLKKTHVVVNSCNNDMSAYLVPIGTEDQITYSSKPKNSYRISDHWNWYSNVNKCPNESYIQCYNVDLPFARPRLAPGKASKPRFAISVAYFGNDGKYHHVYGEKFNRKTKEWTWEEINDVDK